MGGGRGAARNKKCHCDNLKANVCWRSGAYPVMKLQYVNTKLQVTRACNRIMKWAPGVVTVRAVRTVTETNNKYFLF